MKRTRLLLAVFVVLMFTVGIMYCALAEELPSIELSGSENGVSWYLSPTGVLTIEGTGEMPQFAQQPWLL